MNSFHKRVVGVKHTVEYDLLNEIIIGKMTTRHIKWELILKKVIVPGL